MCVLHPICYDHFLSDGHCGTSGTHTHCGDKVQCVTALRAVSI